MVSRSLETEQVGIGAADEPKPSQHPIRGEGEPVYAGTFDLEWLRAGLEKRDIEVSPGYSPAVAALIALDHYRGALEGNPLADPSCLAPALQPAAWVSETVMSRLAESEKGCETANLWKTQPTASSVAIYAHPPTSYEGEELREALEVAAVQLQLAGGWLREAGDDGQRANTLLNASNKAREALQSASEK